MNFIARIGLFATAAASLAITTSCSVGGKSPSGFLSNYKQLDSGYGTSDAVTSWIKPGVDLKKYDSVMIDPVTTIVATPGVSPQVKDQLAAYLGDALREQIGGSLRVTAAPGPTTLRIRTGLTDVIEGSPSGTPAKTVHMGTRPTLTGKLGSDEIASFVSKVSFEGEILDSQSGERLAALVDHRLGKKREATAATSWAAVQSGINQAVVRLKDRYFAIRSN